MTVAFRKFLILPVAVLSVCLMPATSRATLVFSLSNGSATNTLQFRQVTNSTTALLRDTTTDQNVIQATTNAPGSSSGL